MADYYPDVDSTGMTDVTAEMNAFLLDVPNGSTIHLVPYGLYRMDDTWAFEMCSSITIEGPMATVATDTTGYKNRSHLRFWFCSDMKVRELRIEGANPEAGTSGPFLPELAGQHGVEVAACVGIELDRLTITDVYGDFVYLGWKDKIFSDWVLIHNCVMVRSGRQGIALVGARMVSIEDNVIEESRRAHIDLEPQPGSQGVVVATQGNH